MYGYLDKRSTGKVKYFQKRWYFLISCRPLNLTDYLNDSQVMDKTLTPPLLEPDTIYQYHMDKEGDQSGYAFELETIKIVNLIKKDMSKSSEYGHALIVDYGDDKIHLNCKHRFEMEKWYEAILCSIQTARE
jgi:predicted ATP-grasp superfamily ATP-dependent carboligase